MWKMYFMWKINRMMKKLIIFCGFKENTQNVYVYKNLSRLYHLVAYAICIHNFVMSSFYKSIALFHYFIPLTTFSMVKIVKPTKQKQKHTEWKKINSL